MRTNIFKSLLTIVGLLCSMSSFAYDAEVDGIYFNLIPKAKQAEVTFKGSTYSEIKTYSGAVNIPESIVSDGVTYSVTSIGKYAFRECSSLTSVTIPNSVTSIGFGAFRECYGVTSVTMGNSIETIGDQAFLNCSRLSSVTIPNSVTSIGEYGFSKCYNLASVTIPNSVANIGWYAFAYCSNLNSVTISNSVTSIGGYFFFKCSKLTSVTIPNSITSIGREAFLGCSSLNSLNIPNSVKSIGYGAFSGCSNLTTLAIPNSVTSIDGTAFSDCTGLTTVSIGNSISTIKCGAFSGCSGLTTISIPDGVTTIESQAFEECSGLTSIKISSSVNSIGYHAFASCNKIEEVICYGETAPSMGVDVFKDSYVGYSKLYIPKSTLGSYSAADQWKDFGTIKENNFDTETSTDIDITVSSAKWSTLILPFDATIPSGLKVYSCNASSGDVLTFENQESIKANTPYIINGEAGTYTFSGIGSAWEDTYNGGWFTGAYVETTVPENSYILAKVSGVLGFYKVTGDNVGKTKVAPYHCYLTPSGSGSAKSAFYLSGDDATGINEINGNAETDTKIFDITGRQQTELHKGINIVNGKKIIIK